MEVALSKRQQCLLCSGIVHSVVAHGAQMYQVEEKCLIVGVEFSGE